MSLTLSAVQCISERPTRRGSTLLSIPVHRSNFFSKSFTVQACRLWNSLPDSIRIIEGQGLVAGRSVGVTSGGARGVLVVGLPVPNRVVPQKCKLDHQNSTAPGSIKPYLECRHGVVGVDAWCHVKARYDAFVGGSIKPYLECRHGVVGVDAWCHVKARYDAFVGGSIKPYLECRHGVVGVDAWCHVKARYDAFVGGSIKPYLECRHGVVGVDAWCHVKARYDAFVGGSTKPVVARQD
ncbi:hypothetical protein J6590_069034 [Homalodisca vitripennis]|nr:hypothetical protein J6590_069034 [Homalodisca vitripennis]